MSCPPVLPGEGPAKKLRHAPGKKHSCPTLRAHWTDNAESASWKTLRPAPPRWTDSGGLAGLRSFPDAGPRLGRPIRWPISPHRHFGRAMQLTLGHMHVQVVSGGTLRLDGGAMFGVVPRPAWERRCPPDGHNRIAVDTNRLLIRTADRSRRRTCRLRSPSAGNGLAAGRGRLHCFARKGLLRK